MARGDVSIVIEVTGVPGVSRKLHWTPSDIQRLGVPLLKIAKRMLTDADTRVPVKTGNLQATGKTRGPGSIHFGNGVEVEIEYGGAAAKDRTFPDPAALPPSGQVDYAAQVHELTARSGELKWLERAAEAHLSEIAPEVLKTALQIMAEK